jgi:glycosyltransferase involved in cell wall biosynthesis
MTYIEQSNIQNLLTIVIPCKNEEKYIGNLLEDLFYSVELDYTKIIIADANSTDNTKNVIEDWKQTYGLNIEVIQGGTVSEGRNNGAKLATTPYILFLDADVRLFSSYAIYDAVNYMHQQNIDLVTLSPKNYGTEWQASLLFYLFSWFNKVMAKFTPFAIGAFFLTRRSKFEELGGFPSKYDTSEDYILSKKYDPKKFKILNDYFGQDERRFKKLGYFGMLWYMTVNFFNRNNLAHFEKAKVNYWN